MRPRGLLLPAAATILLVFLGSGEAMALCADPGIGAGASYVPAQPPGRTIALTFDAAWSADGADEILDALAAEGVRATFFVAGRFVRSHPEIARRIASEGHEAGNHTYHHDLLTRPGLTQDFFRSEMEETRAAYEEATGIPLAPIWRAPYGAASKEILAWGREAGYAHVRWSEGFDALDWVSDLSSSLYHPPIVTVARILRRLDRRSPDEGPAILLLHLGSLRPPAERFAAALPDLIDGVRRLGYRFVTASEAMKEGRFR